MASISSIGVGSGLDIKSIVSKLVELEKAPLQKLKLQAESVNAKISAFGEVKSLISTLSDAASKLTSVTGWNGVAATSSDSAAVSVTAIGGASATSFGIEVTSLANAQSTASASVKGAVGTGTLTIALGKWDSAGPSATGVFTGKTPASSVDIAVSASDSIADIAVKINGANAGVTATILTDKDGQRLLLRSKETGEASGFNLTATGGVPGGLDRLATTAIDPAATQKASDAVAKVNGMVVTSSTNTFANTVAGVTFKVEKLTDVGKPVQINVAKDNSAVQANITAFVDAYNAVNTYLSEATKYDAGTKEAGLFQGDSTAIGLQNSLRAAMQSVSKGSGVFKTLTDLGIGFQRGGNLAIDSTKLSKALENADEVKKMFRGTDAVATGLGATIKSMTTTMLSTGGFFSTKNNSLQLSLKSNTKAQAGVNTAASNMEARLNARYSALDSQMSKISALNAYVNQQITTWNKSTG